jgi:hypothetical protein
MAYSARPHVGSESKVSYGLWTGADFNTAPAAWVQLHSIKDVRITLPSKTRKMIPDGLNSSAYSAPGRSVIGELELQALYFPTAGIIANMADKKVSIKIETYDGDPNDGGVLVATTTLADWKPMLDVTHPEGDGDSTVSAKGQYMTYTLVAA